MRCCFMLRSIALSNYNYQTLQISKLWVSFGIFDNNQIAHKDEALRRSGGEGVEREELSITLFEINLFAGLWGRR